MADILSCTNSGVCKISVSTIEELNSLDKSSYSPTSEVFLCGNGALRIFMLSGDKSEWVERASSSVMVEPFSRENL